MIESQRNRKNHQKVKHDPWGSFAVETLVNDSAASNCCFLVWFDIYLCLNLSIFVDSVDFFVSRSMVEGWTPLLGTSA